MKPADQNEAPTKRAEKVGQPSEEQVSTRSC